ncbi:hypothetical protein XENORESO_018287 [Xenotaenia resolanae]|uniref:Uncharacterized protein n=1 Tax=Xenotaenia resolanae TaxID=208358 RepID=A0ABV0WN84_9TELE
MFCRFSNWSPDSHHNTSKRSHLLLYYRQDFDEDEGNKMMRFDDETGGSNNEKERFARYGVKSGEQDVIGGCLWDSIKTALTPILFPTLSFFFLFLLSVLHFLFW